MSLISVYWQGLLGFLFFFSFQTVSMIFIVQNCCSWQHQLRPEELWRKCHSCSLAMDNSWLAVALQRVTARKFKNAWVFVQRGNLFFYHSSGLHVCVQRLSSSPAGIPETVLLTVFPSLSSSDLSFKCQLWDPFEVTCNLHFTSSWFSLGIPQSQHIKNRLWYNF